MTESIDSRIRARVEAGDLDSAATLAIRQYGPELLGYLKAVARDGDLANEAFALGCELIWKALARFRWEASIRTWCYQLVRRALSQVRDTPHRKPARNLPASLLDSIEEARRSSTAPYQRTETKEAFRELRETLAPLDHELLILRLDREMQWKEIAIALAVEDCTVDQRATALRKRYERLKDQLRELAVARGLLE